MRGCSIDFTSKLDREKWVGWRLEPATNALKKGRGLTWEIEFYCAFVALLLLGGALLDPGLELHDANGANLIANDNWTDDAVSAGVLTANGLALQDPKLPT
ncbi:MAG: hypothetical protein QOJ87_2686 [Verrucomicrobiota bacterium]